jgi:hypothetical protein
LKDLAGLERLGIEDLRYAHDPDAAILAREKHGVGDLGHNEKIFSSFEIAGTCSESQRQAMRKARRRVVTPAASRS